MRLKVIQLITNLDFAIDMSEISSIYEYLLHLVIYVNNGQLYDFHFKFHPLFHDILPLVVSNVLDFPQWQIK